MNLNINMLSLEEEMTNTEEQCLEEEKANANKNYALFNTLYTKAKNELPYPDVNEYTTATYDELADLNYKKRRNSDKLNEMKEYQKYINDSSLYLGHCKIDKLDIYFMDQQPSKKFDDRHLLFLNINDKDYQHLVKNWRFPSNNQGIQFSRNIVLKNYKVKDVDLIYETENEAYSKITDAYLRKALLRNKDYVQSQGIIQTIQQKQDYIRSYDKDHSFIVQGLAGSGKTMVLLHRLRYLLYNNEIKNNDFIFLIPNDHFKTFISDFSNKFKISKYNIQSYQEYYCHLSSNKKFNPTIVKDELTLDGNLLKDLYSEELMQICYEEFFNQLEIKNNDLIAYLKESLPIKYETNYNDFKNEITKLKLNYRKSLHDLNQLNRFEQLFTLKTTSYIYKLEDLYPSLFKKINSNPLINQNEINKIKLDLSNLYRLKKHYDQLLENYDDYFKRNYSIAIQSLNQYIKDYSKLNFNCETLVENLVPFTQKLTNIILKGVELASIFVEHEIISAKQLSKHAPLYNNRSKKNLRKYLADQFLFSIIKNIIANYYDIKINESYKHYWYLKLYANYLCDTIGKFASYVFIDEAQDLSISEIHLIKKINYNKYQQVEPVMNLFGDINQTISKHGIQNWNDLNFSYEIFKLDENFRNTNQIIDYCNRHLPFKMGKIGVDMEKVKEYNDFQKALKINKKIHQQPIIIVKDEDMKVKFEKKYHTTNTDHIFTVKESKGLEFKEVFVIDEKMTSNEKYIAYTRALASLNVIHQL